MMPGRLVHVTVASVFGYTTPGGTPPAKLASKGQICLNSARAHGRGVQLRTEQASSRTLQEEGNTTSRRRMLATVALLPASHARPVDRSMDPCPGSFAIENHVTESDLRDLDHSIMRMAPPPERTHRRRPAPAVSDGRSRPVSVSKDEIR
jgi:hypothetical protein